MTITGIEEIINPLQESKLNKKGLCDYVINVATGCTHGCSFCYVPSTPVIRTNQQHLKEKGINDPQLDWGKYLLIREDIPEKLTEVLEKKKTWKTTPSGKGVVLLSSGTDPYQNKQTAKITLGAVEILLKHKKRIRILTRSPLWLNHLNTLVDNNITVGMSLPYLDDELSRKIEPFAPPPSLRYNALLKGHQRGCRLYVAIAPTPPMMKLDDFQYYLEKIMKFKPEVIFWEPINARGSNGKRMLDAGLDFASIIADKKNWAENFILQWDAIETAAKSVGCLDRLHIWADAQLKGFVDETKLTDWIGKPTVEQWANNI
ncbi:Radical SAM domain protein (plasmid) [Gloeothece citriformis PCC 7424]|uniref:Radical SAM domain protein n=1 Tax=Gloeothece citriformis (strain PCC 7424) TaxID=65393 RepID=B7KMN4_GLOC7|nr:radical SAM protein [Gloeothece citriformis]ACK74056.1 Radical SAM domain protein [Gloeothece citriformis PCC 7424]